MFNKDVLTVLSQINNITNSIILKYPETIAISEAQDMMVYYKIDDMDSEPFPDIGLKDSLSEFLNIFKLFPDDRNVSVDGLCVNIKSGELSSSFITDNIALMDSYNKSKDQFTKTESVPSVCKFSLTTDDIKNLKSASGVFKDLSEVIIKSQDGDVKVFLGATNKFNARSNTFSVTKNADSRQEFELKIPIENFKMIPQSDYTFDIKYNSQRNSYRILASNESLNGFKIILTQKIQR